MSKWFPIVGTLRHVLPDLWWIESATGEKTPLVFSRHDHRPPINVQIALVVAESEHPGYLEVSPGDMYYTVLETPIAESRKTTTKHIGVFARTSKDNDTRAAKAARSHAMVVKKFWKQFARHKWDIKADGWAMKSECSYVPHEFCQRAMKAAFKTVENPEFTPNYWLVLGGGSTRACGQAEHNGHHAVTYAGCGERTSIHEMGHTFGLMHNNTKDPVTGEEQEYRDKTGIMGGPDSRGLLAANMVFLGLADEDEIRRIGQNTQVVIVPHELPKQARRKNEWAYVQVINGNTKSVYYLSTRKTRGGQNLLGNLLDGKLFIHEAKGSATYRLDSIKEGEQSSAIPGVNIEYLEYKNETARVNILFEGQTAMPETETISEEFPDKLSIVELEQKHSGMWGDPSFQGQGIDLQVKGDRFTVAWYTYNEHNTGRRFFVGTGRLKEGPEEFDLYTTEGGSFENPSSAIQKYAGRAQIYFLSDSIGRFNYNTIEYGRGGMELKQVTRSALTNEPSGMYYDPSRNNEGFTVHFLPNDRISLVWYTFGPKDWNSDNQRWYIAFGKSITPGAYTLKLKACETLKFMEISDLAEFKDVGVLIVKVKDNYEIQVDYTLSNADQSKEHEGTLTLHRLF